MIKKAKSALNLQLKPIIFIIGLLFSISIFHIHSNAETITTFRSSDNNKSYYTIELEQDKVILEGKTTEDITGLSLCLYCFDGSVWRGNIINENIFNGSYSHTFYFPTLNGNPNDGRYFIKIYLKDVQVEPDIIVEGGIASFYRPDNFDTDILADRFIKDLNKEDVSSNTECIYNVSLSDLNMKSEQIEEIHKQALEATGEMQTDYEKVKAVYQWVINNIYYDRASSELTDGNGDNNPYSVLKNRYGVCEGYARLTVEMLRSLNIPAVVIGGYALGELITNNSGGAHAWVAIYADGRWFYADPTWDSQNDYVDNTYTKGESSLKFFDLTKEAISNTHRITNVEADIETNDFNVIFYEGHVSLENYQGTDSIILFPTKVKDLEITQISSLSISVNVNVKGVIVPDGYEVLDAAAFQNYWYLEYIVLPDTINSIHPIAFYNNIDKKIYSESNTILETYAEEKNIKIIYEIPSELDYNNSDFILNKIEISIAASSKLNKYTYNGNQLEPEPTLSYKGETLKEGVDYTLSYINNVVPGKAGIIITGIGNFRGEKEINFLIRPEKISAHIFVRKGNAINVNWETPIFADGYEVYCSMKKNGTYKILTDTTKSDYIINNLISKKTYYFKVRPYIIIDSQKVYGTYSNIASVKIK